MQPDIIHAKAEPFSIKSQLSGHFERHLRLAHSRWSAAERPSQSVPQGR